MYRDYFEHDGKKYYSGTIFITKFFTREIETTFLYYDPKEDNYICLEKNKNSPHIVTYWGESFQNSIIRVTDKMDNSVKKPVVRKKFDSEIPYMKYAWGLYIAVMLGALIFKDRVWIWIAATLYFIVWRARRKEEEGEKIEW